VPILDEGRLDSVRARGPDMGLSGHRRHRTPRCRSSTRDVSIRRGLEDPTWDSVGVGGTGLLRRRSIRHGLQDPTGTLGRRSAHDPSVPLDEGCLESVRASGADAGVRGVGAHRLRRCRSTRAVSNRCGLLEPTRSQGRRSAQAPSVPRIGAGFRTAFRGTSSVCGPDSAWERMRGTIRDAWSEWTARSG